MLLENKATPGPQAADNDIQHPLVSKVPDELWLRVFLIYTAGSRPGPARMPSTNYSPFTPSVVCKDWRRIALANSALWDHVNIWFKELPDDDEKEYYPNYSKEKQAFQGQVDMMKLWIERAGERTLSITFSMDDELFAPGSPAGLQLPALVVKNASRIQKLNISMFSDWYSAFDGVDFPVLQTLELFAPEIARQNEYMFSVTLRSPISDSQLDFTRAPKLSAVCINGSFDQGLNIALPWNQITNAAVSYISPGDCPKIMALLPNLKACSLELADDAVDPEGEDDEDDNDFVPWAGDRTVGPVLDSLNLNQKFPAVIEATLNSLPLSLKHLHLEHLNNFPTGPYHPGLYDFILKAIPPFAQTLQSLTLRRTLRHLEPLGGVLPQLLSLKLLDVITTADAQEVDDAFVKDLFVTPRVLPCLETLRLAGNLRIGDGTLLEFVRYRRHVATEQEVPVSDGNTNCVKILDVRLASWVSWVSLEPGVAAELRAMVDGGLNIVISNARSGYPGGPINLIWT